MITMKDIAEKAGVSRTTVSFVLNGRCHKDQRISESVQRKVLATAEKLGYIKNDLVLSLVKGRSYAVGIVSEFKNFTFPIIRGYAQEAQNHGYSVRLFQVDNDIDAALTQAVRARVDAIVCLGISDKLIRNFPEHFLNMEIPVIGLKSGPSDGGAIFDQQGSAAAMTEYLVQCGYRKIICYGGNYRQMPQREAGYREIMEKYQLHAEFFNHNDVSPDEMIDMRPDAFFCGDDFLACRLLQAAYKRNLRVPEAFGVAGFGNTNAGQFSSPALTTVDEPYFESGILHMQYIISMLENKPAPKHEPMTGKIIIRESTQNVTI